MWRDAFRGVPRVSLRVKLVALLLCLLAAAAAVIVTVGASALRGQLTRQAGAQLRTYANQFTSHPFQLLGTSAGAPGAAGPFDGTGTGGGARTPGTAGTAGSPGAARMAGETGTASAPSTVVVVPEGTGQYSIALRSAGGQWLLSAGPGTRSGRALPAPFATVPARTGVLRTVPGVGGSYLVIAEPMHFQARRLEFAYGADDFAVTRGGRGAAGTLVVGLRLAGIGQAVRRLVLLALAVSAAAILIAAGLLWAAIRFFLRPLTRAAHAADVAAAGMGSGSGLIRPVPQPSAGGLTGSLNTVLSQFGSQVTASENAAAAAQAATEQMASRLESVAGALRRPISLLHGRAEHWAHRDRRRSGDPDRALTQVVAQVADAETLLDGLDDTELDNTRG